MAARSAPLREIPLDAHGEGLGRGNGEQLAGTGCGRWLAAIGRALGHVINLSRAGAVIDVLLNVQIPVESGHVRMFVTPEEIDGWYRDEGIAELEPSRIALDAAGLPTPSTSRSVIWSRPSAATLPSRTSSCW